MFSVLSFTTSKVFNIKKYDVDSIPSSELPSLNDSILKDHIALLEKIQSKSKRLACCALIKNFVGTISGKTQLSDIINSVHPLDISQSNTKKYYDIKEQIFDSLLEYSKQQCFEKINSQSMLEKLTRKGFNKQTEDEEEFILGIIYTFKYNNNTEDTTISDKTDL